MASTSEDDPAWSTTEASGWQTAEVANPVAIRDTDRPPEIWKLLEYNLNRRGVELAQPAKAKIVEKAEQSYASLIESCNRCHNLFGDGISSSSELSMKVSTQMIICLSSLLVFFSRLCLVSADGADAGGQPPAIEPEFELVAVCGSPLDQDGWWNAQGETLDEAPQLAAARPAEKPPEHDFDRVSRLFVFTAKVPPTGSVTVDIDGQRMAIRLPEKVDGRDWDDIKEEAKQRGEPYDAADFKQIVYSIGVHALCERKTRWTEAEIRLSTGSWQPVATRPKLPGDGNVIEFDLAELGKDGVETYLPETHEKQVRVVALDDDGKTHHAIINMVVKSERKTAIKVRTQFRLPAADIKAYRLEARPYRLFQIGNIPIYPASISPVRQIRLLGGCFRGDRDLLKDDHPSQTPADLDWIDPVDPQLELIQDCPSIRRVNICGDSLTDQAANILAAASQLQQIRLAGTGITPQSLLHFSDSRAEAIEIVGTRMRSIPDQAIAALAEAPNLQRLALCDSSLTDDNLQALTAATSLTTLRAQGHQLTPAGLSRLGSLKELNELLLVGAKWNDAILKSLTSLQRLRQIDLSGSPVTDAGINAVAELTQLQAIDLRETDVTDEGVAKLIRLEHLDRIDLRGTRCTRKSYETLAKKFPDIRMRLPDRKSRTIEVALRMTDAEGQPVAACPVWMFTAESFSARNNRFGNSQCHPDQLDTGTTNDQGQATFHFETDAVDRWIRIWAVSEDGAPALTTFSVPYNGNRIAKTLRLVKDKVTLRIVDPTGRPRKATRVLALRIPVEVPQQLIDRVTRVTDSSGTVTFSGIDPKKVEMISVSDARFGNQSSGYIRGKLKAEEPTTLQLLPTGSIRGRVLEEVPIDAKKIRGLVYCEGRGEPLESSNLVMRTGWAELHVTEEREISIPALVAGYAHLSDQTESNEFRLRWPTVQITPDSPTRVEVPARQPVRVEGLIRTVDDWQPAANLDLQARRGDGHGHWTSKQTLSTDANGRFELFILPGDLKLSVNQYYLNDYRSVEWWLWRNGRFGGHRSVERVSWTRYLEPIDLSPVVRARGRLVNSKGEPLRQGVNGFPAPLDQQVTNCMATRSDSDGYFDMLYPKTHPPVAFRGSDRDSSYRIEQREPLILVDDGSENSQ